MAKKKKSSKKTTKKKYNPISYTKTKNPGNYTSEYTKQIKNAQKEMATARNNLMNFKYDPMKDANYQALAQVYAARGNQAAQDTLGEAAALNGGQQTSFAVSAAQQARNQYNQELASLVPDLEAQAYQRMTTNYGLLQDTYNMYKDLDTEAYGRYRDRVADYQWGKGYDTDIYQYKVQQAAAKSGGGGGGGGRRRSGGGGGGYSGGGSSYGNGSGSTMPITKEDFNNLTAKKKSIGPQPSVPQKIAAIGKYAVTNALKKKK